MATSNSLLSMHSLPKLAATRFFGYAMNRPPFFDGSNYMMWKKRMMIFIKAQDIEIWKVIAIGPRIPRTSNREVKREEDYNDEDWKGEQLNSKAMQILYCALNSKDLNRVVSCDNAKEVWKMLEVTYEGTPQVKETKINMLLHDYELFTMKEGESIKAMLDRFVEITNGLTFFGKPIQESDRVKKILRSLSREWDATVTPIMECKDLNKLEFSALVGSLLNYEIVLKSRGAKAKTKEKEKGIALKTFLEESEEEHGDLEEDEEVALYAKNMRRCKTLIERRRRELKKEPKGNFKRNSSSTYKKNDDTCYNCGRIGHHQKDCRLPSSKLPHERNKGKTKEAYIATWSDEEDEDERREENNLALMSLESYSSDEESEVSFSTHDDELLVAFENLNDDYAKLVD